MHREHALAGAGQDVLRQATYTHPNVGGTTCASANGVTPLVQLPEYGCEECSSLISAIGSYLVAFLQRLFSPNETEPDPEPETWW